MDKSFKVNNFDLLRIFAASQVMVGHTVWHLDIATPAWLIKLIYAFPGVPIFFFISGFLISASFERSSSVQSYARNRILRIYPGLWCCIIATVVVYALLGLDFVNSQTPVWFVTQLAGLIYTPPFMKNFGFGSYNGSLWSIPVELQFYVLLPILYRWCRSVKNPDTWFVLFWIVFVAIAFVYNHFFPPLDDPQNAQAYQKILGYTFAPHFYLFLTGVLLQRAGLYRSRWIAGKGLYWTAGYLAVFLLWPPSPVASVVINMLLAVTALSLAYTVPTAAHKLLRGNDVSYGVYIYHALIINAFIELGLTGQLKYFFLLTALVYVVAYLSWTLVEKTFIRKKKQTISPEFAATQ